MPILPSIGRDVSRVLGVDSDAARRLLLGRSGQLKREQAQGEAQSREQALEARIRELMAKGVPYEVALKRASEDFPLPPPTQYPTVEFPLRPELDGTVPAALDSFPSGPPPKRPRKWAPGEGEDGDDLDQWLDGKEPVVQSSADRRAQDEEAPAEALEDGEPASQLPHWVTGIDDLFEHADTFIDDSSIDAPVPAETAPVPAETAPVAAKVVPVAPPPEGRPSELATSGRIELPPEPEVGGRPETIARILEVLGGIGAGIGESRSIGKANKLTAQRQALSNLVNTLRGSATTGVARETPRAGLLQTLGAGLGAGGRTFRAGRKAGRDERNVAARQEFEDRIERQKGEAGALKALTGARGKPGLTAAEVRLYETFGENIVTGDPFSSFDPSLARQQILANNPGILETDMVAALSAVRAAATDRQREERKIVQDALADVFKEKGEVAPSQLVSQWETIVFTNGIYVPVEETERVIKAIEATAAITPLSAGNRTKLSNLFALRSGISRILGRLQDPAFEKHLSLLGSRKNALLGGISPRLYPPEVRQAMTELGFTSELLLRTFTGAAAPQTEFERFGQLFVGTLTDGRQALVSQLTGLDNGLQDQVNEIFVAAREGRGYKEPDRQDGDQEAGAAEDISQEVLEALGELVAE